MAKKLCKASMRRAQPEISPSTAHPSGCAQRPTKLLYCGCGEVRVTGRCIAGDVRGSLRDGSIAAIANGCSGT